MEKYNLKWKDFQTNVVKSLSEFRNQFTDVTLSSDDGKLFKSHKLVLSSSSDYFKEVLSAFTDEKELILCLNGVKALELQSILKYLYEGEVQIGQEYLDSFFEATQRLKIFSIIRDTAKEEETVPDSIKNANLPDAEDSKLDVPLVKGDPDFTVNYAEERKFVKMTQEIEIFNKDDINSVEDIITKVGDQWNCNSCYKTMKTKGAIKLHAEGHVTGLSFICDKCGNTYKSRNSLACHKFTKHTAPK